MKWALWLLGAVALGSLAWGSCAQRTASRTQTMLDSAVAVAAVKDSVAQAEAETGARRQIEANRLSGVSQTLTRQADSLRRLLRISQLTLVRPDSTTSDSLRYWRDSAGKAHETAQIALGLAETLQGSLDTLSVAFQAQREAADRFRVAYTTEKDRADGLEKALRAMPLPCRKVLGLFPVPRVGPQFGVIGRQLDFGIQVPLGC